MARWSRRRKLLCVAPLALGVAALLGLAAHLGLSTSRRNFGCVVAGVLYRSGQPGRASLDAWVPRYGIRTIVNLRTPQALAKDRDAHEEAAFVQERNIKFVLLPMTPETYARSAAKFRELMADRSNHPVLVHCAKGKERTGVLVADYRISFDGWSAEQAIREAHAHGLDPDKVTHMVAFIREWAARAAAAPR
jgi:protein tyrosine/serine phosphatase